MSDSSSKLVAVCRRQFEKCYGYSAEKAFFAPGRINIIGEHIDYNGGLVFPCAIGLGTAAAVGRCPKKSGTEESRTLRLYSHNFPEVPVHEFMLPQGNGAKEWFASQTASLHSWLHYPLGMLCVLQDEGLQLDCDLDIVVFGNLPVGGSGLSSSASLEVLIGYILQSYGGLPLPLKKLALLAQRAENEFCGTQCGIMDQFIISVAQAKRACLLNCANLDYEQIPLELDSHIFLVGNTMLPRQLRESKYNERRAECEQALKRLQQSSEFAGLDALCSIPQKQLGLAFSVLANQGSHIIGRVRHAVTEQGRSHAAAAAVSTKNWPELGALLNASHRSLREDYEVSGVHLDSLVRLLQREPITLGARMTGAGFGGCCIALLQLSGDADQKSITELEERVGTAYCEEFGWRPEFYASEAVNGVRELQQN